MVSSSAPIARIGNKCMKIPNTELQQVTEDDWAGAEKQEFGMIDEADERLIFVHNFL